VEGQRCLVSASCGSTLSRLRNGRVLHRFSSCLPSGSADTFKKRGEFCLLDCIFNRASGTYYVIDVMTWKGQLLYDCTAEFRLFWIRSKISELLSEDSGDCGDFQFRALPVFDASVDGIRRAYQGELSYRRDGLLFLHKRGTYATGPSPLALVWKDGVCSPYFIDTKSDGTRSSRQNVNLRLNGGGYLETEEGFALGRILPDTVRVHSLECGDILRYQIDAVVLRSPDDDRTSPEGARLSGLKFVRKCGMARCAADTWSKILFQHNARNEHLDIRSIASFVEASSGAPLDEAQ